MICRLQITHETAVSKWMRGRPSSFHIDRRSSVNVNVFRHIARSDGRMHMDSWKATRYFGIYGHLVLDKVAALDVGGRIMFVGILCISFTLNTTYRTAGAAGLRIIAKRQKAPMSDCCCPCSWTTPFCTGTCRYIVSRHTSSRAQAMR